MSDHNTTHTDRDTTHTYVERTDRSGGSRTFLAFVLGGVVVVLGLIVWLFWGDVDRADGDAGNVSVTVETPADGGGAETPPPAAEGDADAGAPAAD